MDYWPESFHLICHSFEEGLHLKYAGPGGIMKGGAGLNTEQEPNHWKTLTVFH